MLSSFSVEVHCVPRTTTFFLMLILLLIEILNQSHPAKVGSVVFEINDSLGSADVTSLLI
jgi:hypothetical protein